jgi:hypothetical protein
MYVDFGRLVCVVDWIAVHAVTSIGRAMTYSAATCNAANLDVSCATTTPLYFAYQNLLDGGEIKQHGSLH